MSNRRPRKAWQAGLIAALVAAACQTGPEPVPGSGASALQPAGDGYAAPRPIGDFYDSLFVLTDPAQGGPRQVTLEALADVLAQYHVILYGESHGHSGVHAHQQALFRELHERSPNLILSLEQFERDVQPVLDSYLAGKIGEEALKEGGRAWENYTSSYRPLVEYARMHRIPVLAANAPNWAIVCIGQQGPGVLDRFSPADRGFVARELDLSPGAYRNKFMAFQSGSTTHGGGATSEAAKARAERSYAAQVARDETMAETIVAALAGQPNRKVLHLNGSFHSSGFLGVAERIKRRAPDLRVAVIEPLEAKPGMVRIISQDEMKLGTVLQVIHASPEMFREGEDQSAWIASMMSRRRASACKYPDPVGPAAQ